MQQGTRVKLNQNSYIAERFENMQLLTITPNLGNNHQIFMQSYFETIITESLLILLNVTK